jgi:PAS domain S-box-containing protein
MDLAAELLHALPDPVIGCDAAGAVILWNRAAETTYGYPAGEAVGRRAATLLRTRFPAPLLEISEDLADLGQWQGRLEHQTKEGLTVCVESRWIARRDPQGAFAGNFAVEREVVPGPDRVPPRQPRAEPETAGAAGGGHRLVHEFNNSLAVILNYATFVATEVQALDAAPTDAQRQALGRDLNEIQSAAERAIELTRRLAE